MKSTAEPTAVTENTIARAFEHRGEDARVAVDRYFDFLHTAISSIPTAGTQFNEKLKHYSEINVEAARDYMHKLRQATDFAEVLRIQVAFAQAQYNAFSGQAKELAEAFTKEAGALKTPLKNAA
jgi:hypothetical protein